jgi:antitoxin MazE
LKWGNSLAIRIPKAYATETEISEGVVVDLTRKADKLIITVPRESKCSLEEILSRITNDNIHEEIEYGVPEGREIW